MIDLDWNNLRVVLAVARCGSLTGAAKILKLDQTTAGRRLTALESDIGVALFRRAKSGFVATEAGQTVIGEAKAVEKRLLGMKDKLAGERDATAGVVRILGNGWMLSHLAEFALPELLSTHRNLEIRLASRLPPTPVYGEPTVALWFDAAARTPDTATPIARIPFAAYRARDIKAGSDDWVIFRDDQANGPSFTREARRRLGKSARIRLTATDAAILAAAVRGGIGQGILPVCIGERSEGLVRSDARIGRIDRVLHLHTSPDFKGLARVKVVLEWLGGALEKAVGATPLR